MKWGPWPASYAFDHRLDAAGERAEVLHSRAWAWTTGEETDGFVPTGMAARLCPTHTRGRIDALVTHDLWEAVDGGWRLTDWDDTTGDLKALDRIREKAAERQRKRRSRLTSRDTSPPPSRDGSGAEERREEEPPNPPPSGGHTCDPTLPIHTNCRRCGTSRRGTGDAHLAAQAAAAEAALAAHDEARRNVPWCGTCDQTDGRRITTDRGVAKCPTCHPDVVVGPPARPPLRVVGAHR